MESRNTLTQQIRIAEKQQHSSQPLKQLYHWLSRYAAWWGIFVFTLGFVFLTIVLNPAIALGTDTLGHLHRAGFMGEALRTYGLTEGFVQSAWLPDWYMGDPVWVFYPPLTMWILGPMTALTGDAIIAYRLFLSVLFFFFAFSIVHIGLRWGRSRVWAVIGAVIALTAPYTMRIFFIEGNIARGIVLVLLPWIIWYSERILSERSIYYIFTGLSLLWMVAILAHPMQAAMFVIAISFYLLFRTLTNIFVPLRRTAIALLPILLGLGLSAFFWLPAYSGLESGNVPSLPDVKVEQFALPFEALIPFINPSGFLSIGVAAVLLGLFITVSNVREYHIALFGTACIAFLLSFGEKTGVYRLLPLNQLLMPERFAAIGVIFLVFVLITVPSGFVKRRYLFIPVVLVLFVDSLPVWQTLDTPLRTARDQNIATILESQDMPGRIAPLMPAGPTAAHIFYTTHTGDRANISGWALEHTPHQFAIRRLYRATEEAPDYVDRVLTLWNTDYAITDRSTSFLRNFSPVTASQDYILWERSSPSNFAQALPEDQMLIIGENATDWLFAFPFSLEGHSDDLNDYSPRYLQNFSVIGVTQATSDDIEAALGDWVRAGNTLIIDLSGMGQAYNASDMLFGVRAVPFVLDGTYRPRYPPALRGLPTDLDFSTPAGAWVGTTYYDADETLATVREDGQAYSLLSRSQVGEGQVYFIGFNLISLLRQYEAAVPMLVAYLLGDTDVRRELYLPEVPMQVVARKPAELTLTYKLQEPVQTVLSMTYFPRWHATLDGQPLEIENHENLMLLSLPAGEHTLSLTYHPFGTHIAQVGLLISGLFLFMTATSALLLRQNPTLSYNDRKIIFTDRVPPEMELPDNESEQYTPCPACGFKLAYVGTPNVKTYPFNAVDCPICGFSLTEETLAHQKEPLTDFDKRRLFRRWLQQEHITHVGFAQRFGFPLEDAFTDPMSDLQYDDSHIVDPVIELAIARGKRHWVRTVAFHGAWGASAGRDRNIRLWREGNEDHYKVLMGHRASIQTLAFHPSGRWLASGSDDHTIRFWQINDGREMASPGYHLAEVLVLEFSRNGHLLFSGGHDNVIRVWDGKKKKQTGVLRGHDAAVTCLAAGEKYLASGSVDGTVRLWDVEDQTEWEIVLRFGSPVIALNFDGVTVAAIDQHGVLKIWNMEFNTHQSPTIDLLSPLKTAAFANGGYILGCVTDQVHLFDTLSGQQLAKLELDQAVDNIVFNIDELATIYSDGTLSIWRIEQITDE